MIGRRHDLVGCAGVAIVWSNDLAAVQRWIGKWNAFLDLELTAVVADEASAAVGGHIVADNNACFQNEEDCAFISRPMMMATLFGIYLTSVRPPRHDHSAHRFEPHILQVGGWISGTCPKP
jgi:hypothetical protein